jgi:type I restriction enzyme M protein
MTPKFSQTAAYIWNLADLLRGDFKQSQYGRIILPSTVLRRLECVLEATKGKVLVATQRGQPAVQDCDEGGFDGSTSRDYQ